MAAAGEAARGVAAFAAGDGALTAGEEELGVFAACGALPAGEEERGVFVACKGALTAGEEERGVGIFAGTARGEGARGVGAFGVGIFAGTAAGEGARGVGALGAGAATGDGVGALGVTFFSEAAAACALAAGDGIRGGVTGVFGDHGAIVFTAAIGRTRGSDLGESARIFLSSLTSASMPNAETTMFANERDTNPKPMQRIVIVGR